MDRRGFLEPGRLLRAVTTLERGLDAAAEKAQRWASESMVTLTQPAMACEFEFLFAAREPDRRAALEAFDQIHQLEDQLSVYRPDSEVSRINDSAYLNDVPVEPLLFGLLRRCRKAYERTEGAFDITAGPLIRGWGFRRRQGVVPPDEEIDRLCSAVGMDKIRLDDRQRTIRFLQPGMEINLGGVGKGYSLDQVSGHFRRRFRGALLSAGHSSLLAIGTPTWDDAWRIDVLFCNDPSKVLATVRLTEQGFSTSGTAEQFFEQEGRRYGHLLDPRTGRPVEGMWQASVVAPTAEQAEILSTAFFVLGPDWAECFCRDHPRIGALFVMPRPDGSTPLVRRVGAIDARILSDARE